MALTMALTSLDRREVSFPDVVPSKNATSWQNQQEKKTNYGMSLLSGRQARHARNGKSSRLYAHPQQTLREAFSFNANQL